MNLKELKDEELIRRIKEDKCSDSIIELTSRHQGLIADVARRYASAQNLTGVCVDDFIKESQYLVYQAANDYDKTRNTKFSTWLGNKVNFHCLNVLGKEKKYYNFAEQGTQEYIVDSVYNEEQEYNESIERESDYVLSILDQIKDARVKEVVKMRYFSAKGKNVSFGDIAKEMNMSKQGVINLHDSFMAFVRQKILSKDNMDRI